MTEYLWQSPGGVYVVPDEWRRQFLAEFPDYRVRWSLKKGCWQLEQSYGRGALPPVRLDEADDTLVRARDGYWLVMEFSPGDRMPCPASITHESSGERQRCNHTLKVPMRKGAEIRCPNCRAHGRDGRTMASYWPFDELLMEHLRRTNPLTHGTVRVAGHTRTRAAYEADRANDLMLREAEKAQAAAVSSLDYVDYRWLAGIPTAGATRRQIDHTTFT